MRWLNPRQLRGDLLWEEPLPEIWAGLDEAGRGPLAGTVVAAAVVLPPTETPPPSLEELDDSKKLRQEQRERLALAVRQVALSYAVKSITPEEIDATNILKASMKAMKEAFEALDVTVPFAFVDGTHLPELSCPAEAIVKGDSRVASIAAASVLAKVERDRQMVELDETYPVYGFRWNKGYATLLHRIALELFGPSPEHRRSFLSVIQDARLSSGEREDLRAAVLTLRSAATPSEMEECIAHPLVRGQCTTPEKTVYVEKYADFRVRELKGKRIAERDA